MKTRKVDPVDHSRTFRQHAGETFTYGPHAPGVAGAAVAVVALVIGLCAFATGRAAGGTAALIVAAVLGGVAAVWLLRSHRKVRAAELHWHAEHSDEPAPPPAS
ncbi:hypothetical protein [Mycobacterium sp. E3198]|uniref:hypothetical protein n=1 Tax=Mycobacterium sp. E3198 TaxID=1834143 RepID=UPI000801C5E6|nr:hypothetical protein [Mycobacterium sp. E3198]OBG29010.1 hypothetical protein A5673_05215 [Mycobacterium sp. E3198]